MHFSDIVGKLVPGYAPPKVVKAVNKLLKWQDTTAVTGAMSRLTSLSLDAPRKRSRTNVLFKSLRVHTFSLGRVRF